MPVYKKGAVWYCVVERGRDPVTNKRKQQWVAGGPTKKGAQELLTRLNHERDTGTMLDANTMTTGAYLDHWLETVVKGKRRTTTYERYGVAVRKQLVPHIGKIALQKLTPLHLARMYGQLVASGLSASSIIMAHNVLHGALKQAVRWQMVARNVADAASPAVATPTGVVDIGALWTHEQTRHFLDVLRAERLRAFFVVEINTGMRRGEMIGLRWPAVDLARGEIDVREQRVKVKGGTQVQPPKTAKGRRSIVLSPDTAAILREYHAMQATEREQFGDRWACGDYVFTTARGNLLHPSTVDRLWRQLERKAGTPHMPFHHLRHLNATLLLDAGIHPKVVQERLGHSSITMTLDKYSHVSRDLQHAAALALDVTLGGAVGEEKSPLRG